jgi:Arylsulfotransferase (ASST)
MGRTSGIVLALLIGAGLSSSPAHADAPSSSSGLHVIPFPGTPDAASQSDVIFSSLRPAQIISVIARGSRSGPHHGGLHRLPDGAGTAWVPTASFADGEQVRVMATLTSPAGGTASGDPGSRVLRFSFRTAVPSDSAAPAAPVASATTQSAAAGAPPIRSFVSEPSLHPVAVTAGADPDRSSGDVFLTPRLTIHAPDRFGKHYHHVFSGGPMILNGQGQLVWFRPFDGTTANLEVQRYRGRRVLTWWQKATRVKTGQDVIVDRSYRTVAVVHAGNGYSPDTHEFQLTPQGTALIDAHVSVRANLTGVGGRAAGVLSDYVVQELDVRTGQLLWEWHAEGHIPLPATHYGPPKGNGPYDYLHLNSIQQLPDGNLLISGRHTWGVYLIDKQTGKIIWTLGGRYSNFKSGPGARFEWQHDARLIGNTLTVFDDAAKPGFQEERESTVKAIRLDLSARTATLVHRYSHFPPILTPSQGSGQTLPNGNIFVGWGASPEFSEYRPGGKQIFNGSFPLGVESYRAYRFLWSGDPVAPPSLQLLPGPDGTVKAYSSWNGATNVAAWRVLGGARPGGLSELEQARDVSFETAVGLRSEPPYFAVQALDRSGHVLGTSPPQTDPPHVVIFGRQAFVNASTGSGPVAVGCFTGHPCRLSLKVSSGGSVLAQLTSSHVVPASRATLIDFKLSGAGRRELNLNNRLRVKMRLSDGSGATAVRKLTLVRYRVSASKLPRSVTPAPHIRIIQTTGFVSDGQGQILAACYAAVPCAMRLMLTSGGQPVAETAAAMVGTGEVAAIPFRMTAAGRSMLRGAPGNQLPVRVVLSHHRQQATGKIVLVGYR